MCGLQGLAASIGGGGLHKRLAGPRVVWAGRRALLEVAVWQRLDGRAEGGSVALQENRGPGAPSLTLD